MELTEKYDFLSKINAIFVNQIDCRLSDKEYKKTNSVPNQIEINYLGFKFILRSSVNVFTEVILIKLYEITESETHLNNNPAINNIETLNICIYKIPVSSTYVADFLNIDDNLHKRFTIDKANDLAVVFEKELIKIFQNK